MNSESVGWPGRHFSLANSAEDRPTDLPHLLRRVADQIDQYGIKASEILDVTVSSEIEAEGPHWSVTVHWSPDATDEVATATYVGIDGCSRGWVVATISSDGAIVSLDVRTDLGSLIDDIRSERCVAAGIDIPIGLPERGARPCDIEARQLIGSRRSSVFPAPVRGVLGSDTYQEAAARSLSIQGKSISKQAFAILPKIEEVDQLMTSKLQNHMIEVHPEVCFTELSGAPMSHHKATSEGRTERLNALRTAFADVDGPTTQRLVGTQPDDLLDALVAAWSARRWATRSHRQLGGELDQRGLRMEIIA